HHRSRPGHHRLLHSFPTRRSSDLQALAEAIGEEGQVVVLQGVAGTSASRERGQGFDEGIAEYPGIEVVAKQPADFDRTQGLDVRSEEHTSELQSRENLVCRLLLEK